MAEEGGIEPQPLGDRSAFEAVPSPARIIFQIGGV
jgi:hypothetical protein